MTEIQLNLYDPAAVVRRLGAPIAGPEVQVLEPSAQISQLSRLRAANGDSRLSPETAEAVRQGKLPPTVVKPKEKPDTTEVTDTVDLSPEAQQIVGQFTTQSVPSSPAPAAASVATIPAGVPNTTSSGGSSSSALSSPQISISV